MKFERPRGTRDFLPDEMMSRKSVESRITGVFDSFGYQQVLTPVFEHTELFHAKSGQEISQHMYVFDDKGGRSLCLRPEATASIARMLASGLKTMPKPVKVYYSCPMYRYEEPQKGRYREFWQAGVELVGMDSHESDAEVVLIASECLRTLGVEHKLRVSDLRVLKHVLAASGLKESEQDSVIHLLDKGDIEGVKAKVRDESFFKIIGLKGGLDAVEAVEKIVGEKIKTITSGFKGILALLDSVGVAYTVDFSMARGLDYYTGMVFDVKVDGLGAQDQVCGGGRYDRLIGLFGGPDTPAVGFAFGFDRVLESMHLQGIDLGRSSVDVYVIAVDDNVGDKAFEISSMLRRSLGGRVVVHGLARKKLSKALEVASNMSASYAVIVGSKELEDGSVILKDMSSGSQEKLAIADIASRIK
ncbi:MAG: histidine--tRNA ligase [Candidatus Altiarchaeota archaeon]